MREGDRVRIISDVDLLRKQQRDHGGWADDMVQAAGKVGTVRNVNYKGDVRVHFGQQYWIFNPDSCQPAPDCAEDSIPLEGTTGTLKGLLQELHEQITEALGPLSQKLDEVSRELGGSSALTDLFLAVDSGDMRKISRLVDQEPGLVHEAIMGMTALHYAAADGQEEATRLLVAKGSNINKGDKDEDTPLLRAIERKHPRVVRTLLELGADVNLSNENGQTPLHIAVLSNSDDVLRLLLQNKASVNRKDIRGDTPLFDAIRKDGTSLSIVDFLLAEADLDLLIINRDGFNALHFSALKNKPRIAERLLARDPSLCRVVMEEKKFSAMHIAAANGYSEMLQVLIKASAPVDARCYSGDTPLHLACSEDFISCARILVENGADVNVLNDDHETPLHLCFGPSRSLMKQLLQRSRPEREEKGLELARYLVQCGARTDLRNRAGATALDTAPVAVREKLTRFLSEMKTTKQPSNENTADSIWNTQASRSTSAKCTTCHARDADVIFLPCAHKLVCRHCAGSAKVCQECRKVIEGKIDTEGIAVGGTSRADTNIPSNDTSGPDPSGRSDEHAEDVNEDEIQVGDKVRIGVDAETFRTIQKQRNVWSRQMVKCIGKTGVVKEKTEQGEFVVDFDGENWRIDPIGLTKGQVVERLKEGDTVRIISDVRLLEEQQRSHRGWSPKMAQSAGKVGQIIVASGDSYVVKFGQQLWTFNPKCCTPAPGCPIDFIASNSQEAALKSRLAERLHRSSSRKTELRVDSPELRQLLWAVKAGDSRQIARMLERNPGLVREEVQNHTALHIAASEGQTEAVRLLVAKGADINKGDDDGDTPLLRCVHTDELETAKVLIELGADINAADDLGLTAVHLAVVGDRTDFVRLLLQNLADVNRGTDEGITPIFSAVAKDTTNLDILDLLLTTGDLDLKVTNEQQATPVHMAVHRDKKRVVEKILARDPSLASAVMTQGLTSLHVAAQENLTDITELLLKASAPVDARTRKQMTPLHVACSHDSLACARILMDNGADVNALDEDGDTPLHCFCYHARKQEMTRLLGGSAGKNDTDYGMPRYLIQHGARPDLRNHSGRTAMDVAPDYLREELISLRNEETSRRTNASTASPQSNADPRKCITCHKHDADVVFLPCAHKLVCRQCVGKRKDCQECGKIVENRIDTEGKPVDASNAYPSNESVRKSENGQEPECKVQ